MGTPFISILIPWISGRGIAPRTIGSWTHSQISPRAASEVIVATPGDGREVFSTIGGLIDDFGIKVLTGAGASYPELINACAREAKAPWILVTELHVEARPDCIARVLDWIREDSIGLMGAPIKTFSKFRNRIGRMESSLYEAASQGWDDSSHWHNVRIRGTALRTRFFLETGGFDARYELACDIAFGLEAGRQGCKFGRIASAHADHWENPNLLGVFGDAYFYSRGEAAFRLHGTPGLAEKHLGRSDVFQSQLAQRGNISLLQLRLLSRIFFATARFYLARSNEQRIHHFRKAYVCVLELGRSSLLNQADLVRVDPPAHANIPEDLGLMGLAAVGIYQDGWVGKKASFLLYSKFPKSVLRLEGMRPSIGKNQIRLAILIDGKPADNRVLKPGDFSFCIAVEGTGTHSVRLLTRDVTPLPTPDGRRVSVLLKTLEFVEAPS